MWKNVIFFCLLVLYIKRYIASCLDVRLCCLISLKKNITFSTLNNLTKSTTHIPIISDLISLHPAIVSRGDPLLTMIPYYFRNRLLPMLVVWMSLGPITRMAVRLSSWFSNRAGITILKLLKENGTMKRRSVLVLALGYSSFTQVTPKLSLSNESTCYKTSVKSVTSI